MIEIEEASAILREHCTPLPSVECPLSDALNKVLSEDVFAREPLPLFTNSAMDGFAVGWASLMMVGDAQGARFHIVGESRAGKPFPFRLRPGEAVRISTGAVVPEGADTIVPVEETEVQGDTLILTSSVKQGQHIRKKGEEIQPGDLLTSAGTLLKPAHLGLLASQGIEQVKVFASPRVSLFVSGDELVPYNTAALTDGQIRDSNSLILSSSIRQAGGDLLFVDHLPDDLQQFEKSLLRAAERADLIIMSGGASVGEHDHLRQAAETTGFHTLFWRVRQQPGKPLFASKRDNTLLIGLPGNPVSALVCFEYYVVPVIRSLRGLSFGWEMVRVRLGANCSNPSKRARIQPVTIEQYLAFAIDWKGSHQLTFLDKANGLILVPSGQTLEQGVEMEVIRI